MHNSVGMEHFLSPTTNSTHRAQNCTVMMIGDSLMGQAYRATACAFWMQIRRHASNRTLQVEAVRSLYRPLLQTRQCGYRESHYQYDPLDPPCVQIVNGRAHMHLCYCRASDAASHREILQLLAANQTTRGEPLLRHIDLLILSPGVHEQNLTSTDLQAYSGLLSDVSSINPSPKQTVPRDRGHPHLIWLESYAQHFPTASGLFPNEFKSYLDFYRNGKTPPLPFGNGCRQIINASDMMRASNQTNDQLDALVRKMAPHAPIFPAWELSRTRGSDHVGKWKEHYGYDCTHFCEPSPFLDLVGTSLASAVSSLGRNC